MKDKKKDYLHSKKFKNFLHDEEMRLKNSVLKVFAVFVLLLIGLSLQQITKLNRRFDETIETYSQGVVSEIGQMKEGLVGFANDLNEIRSYLYLPTKDYFAQENTVDQSEENDTSTETSQAVYKLLTDAADKKRQNDAFAKHCQWIESFYETESFLTENLTKSELIKNEEVCSFKISEGEVALYNLLASKANKNGVVIQSALGEEEFEVSENTEEDIITYITGNAQKIIDLKKRLEDQKVALGELSEKEAVKKALEDNQLTLGEMNETPEYFNYPINGTDGLSLSEIQINRKTGDFKLGELAYKQASELESDLIEHLSQLGQGSTQGVVQEKRQELEAIFKEKAFESLLSETNLSVSQQPREEDGRLIYDIKNEQGEVHMSIILDVGSGELKLRQNEEETDLLSILHTAGEEKKNLELPEVLPEFGDSPKDADGITILVAGKHGSLVDTMMIVRLADGKISVVSVPRDLYWNGRKINSVYAFYGMEELVRVLSQLSGYQIDHYALIDMYAFIEVVDLIGCLDVTLEQTLIDPTYRTEDNGVWGTLYYPAGTHHLCGKQALRVARSRYTSSDFSRAERQHLILEALKNKARDIGLRDADKLKGLAETTLEYVETDLNAAQVMAYYFRFKDFEMNRGYVLTSGNVLESTYTGERNGTATPTCTTNEETGEETCTAGNKGAYILLPRNGNWNNIKWYFQQAFENDGEGI